MPPEQTLRSLAAEAGVSTREALERLKAAEIQASNHSTFRGRELAQARKALGLERRDAGRLLAEDELVLRMLGPLRRKGKVSRARTTDFTNVWHHGVPPHQRDEARELAERMLREGLLDEKPSVGRHHVWVTDAGLARLAAAEQALGRKA